MVSQKAYIEKVLARVQTVALDIPNERQQREVRVSSLPYCPILDYREQLFEDQTRAESAYDMDFYTVMGTAIHNVMQMYMPHVEKVWGNWKCPKCKTFSKYCFWPGICKKCGLYPRYVEIEFKVDKLLSGHTDLITKNKFGWNLWDFKTTGSKYIRSYLTRYLPHKKHVIQVGTYAYLMDLIYNIRIDYLNIIYVSRDNLKHKTDKLPAMEVISIPFTDELYTKYKKIVEKTIEGRRQVFNALNTANVKGILANKPCMKKADFYNYMSAAWFKEKCKYHENNKCYNNDKMLKVISSWQKKATFGG